MNILSQFKTPVKDCALHNTTVHSHQFWQIDYYEGASKMTVTLNGETFIFKERQQPLIIIPAYVNHKIVTQGPYVCYALKFESDFTPFSQVPYCTVPLDFDGELCRKILSLTEYKNEIETQILCRLIDILMLKILQKKGISIDISSKKYDTRIERSIIYMNTALLSKPSTEALASHVNMSVTHFCRIFRKETGKTPMEYQRDLIIQKAEKMLKYTDLTVSNIADTLKFPDIHTFSRTFKKTNGISPKEYRKK